MRDYTVNTDKLVNRLVPHYLGGRRLVLFLQSCMQPLNSLAKQWKEWADEKILEASTTSQVILLEYYLNHKFNKYLSDKSQRIVISDGTANGLPIYREGVETPDHTSLYYEDEGAEQATVLRYKDEQTTTSDVSFAVSCPLVDPQLISEEEMTAMISSHVRKYCIAGKKFKVIYE